jgi:hypothetical protein
LIQHHLTKLAQAVIAAHARIDRHADEVVAACETACQNAHGKLADLTGSRIAEATDQLTKRSQQSAKEAREHVAERTSSLLTAVQSDVAARFAQADSSLRAQISGIADADKRTADDIRNQLAAITTGIDGVTTRLDGVTSLVDGAERRIGVTIADLAKTVTAEAHATREQLAAATRRASTRFWWIVALLIVAIAGLGLDLAYSLGVLPHPSP